MSATFEALPNLFQDAAISTLYDIGVCVVHGVTCAHCVLIVCLCAAASPTARLRKVCCVAVHGMCVSEHMMWHGHCSVNLPDCVRKQQQVCWGLGQA